MEDARVLELIDKGLTSDEIRAMISAEKPAEVAETEKEKEKEISVIGEPEKTPEVIPAMTELTELKDIVANLANTIKTMQSENIKTAESAGGTVTGMTAADVISNFIENT